MGVVDDPKKKEKKVWEEGGGIGGGDGGGDRGWNKDGKADWMMRQKRKCKVGTVLERERDLYVKRDKKHKRDKNEK